MGQGRERVARESDAFFGVRGENGPGVGEGVRPGVRGAGGHWLSSGSRNRMWP